MKSPQLLIIFSALIFSCNQADVKETSTFSQEKQTFKFESTGSINTNNKVLHITENDTTYEINLAYSGGFELFEYEDIDTGERYIVLESNPNSEEAVEFSEIIKEENRPKSIVFSVKESDGVSSLEIPYELVHGDTKLLIDTSKIDFSKLHSGGKFLYSN